MKSPIFSNEFADYFYLNYGPHSGRIRGQVMDCRGQVMDCRCQVTEHGCQVTDHWRSSYGSPEVKLRITGDAAGTTEVIIDTKEYNEQTRWKNV